MLFLDVTCKTLYFNAGHVFETQRAQPLASSVVHGKTTLGPAGILSDGGNFYVCCSFYVPVCTG